MMEHFTFFDWITVVFLTVILYVVVLSAFFLAVYVAKELLKFLVHDVIPAPFRFARWLFSRQENDDRIAQIHSIGKQARRDMETLTDAYIRTISGR